MKKFFLGVAVLFMMAATIQSCSSADDCIQCPSGKVCKNAFIAAGGTSAQWDTFKSSSLTSGGCTQL